MALQIKDYFSHLRMLFSYGYERDGWSILCVGNFNELNGPNCPCKVPKNGVTNIKIFRSRSANLVHSMERERCSLALLQRSCHSLPPHSLSRDKGGADILPINGTIDKLNSRRTHKHAPNP